MLVLFAGLALATPTFTATDARDATTAQSAWPAAVACTGREALAHPQVTIARDLPVGWPEGRGVRDEAGLAEFHVHANAPSIVVVRELARAWVPAGPAPLVEGRAELLAECVQSRLTGVSLADDRFDLVGMPDLRSWTEDAAKGWTDAQHDADACAARRLLRAASAAVPRERFWATDALDWAGFRAILGEDPAGQKVLAVIDGDAKSQWKGLSDLDLDGLVAVQEAILGTDPTRWDTDGDGWWDGARKDRPARAVPMPHDGTPTCTGFIPNTGTARAVSGGNVRRPPVWVSATDAVAPEAALHRLASSAPDARLYPGGEWIEVQGDDLVPDPYCVATPGFTVLVEDTDATIYAHPLADALAVAVTRANALLGAPPIRVYARLGGDTLAAQNSPDGVSVTVPVAALAWASKAGALDLLAGDIVAYDGLMAGGRPALRDAGVSEALGQALLF